MEYFSATWKIITGGCCSVPGHEAVGGAMKGNGQDASEVSFATLMDLGNMHVAASCKTHQELRFEALEVVAGSAHGDV